MSRKRFSESEVIETLYSCGIDVPCYRCKEPLHGHKIEREHITEIALGGADEPSNCAYSHAKCHKVVTDGTKATSAGSSKQRIAKVKRILEPKPSRHPMPKTPKRKWPSRGFQKRVKPWRK